MATDKPLTSVAHPYSPDAAAIEQLAFGSDNMVEAMIAIDPDLIVPQAFIIRGRQVVSRKYIETYGREAAAVTATVELMTTFKAWLAIQMPVYDWRQEPEITVKRDFITDNHIVSLYARGRLDLPVRVADHRVWIVELP